MQKRGDDRGKYLVRVDGAHVYNRRFLYQLRVKNAQTFHGDKISFISCVVRDAAFLPKTPATSTALFVSSLTHIRSTVNANDETHQEKHVLPKVSKI